MTVLLHGFWGQPADWNPLLRVLPLGAQILTPDLYEPGKLSPDHDLATWAENFWTWVDEVHGEEPIQLVGYSMGARLAVTAATKNPQRVSRALFLSGNPLFDPQHFAARERMEHGWTKKFLSEDWSALAPAWEEQTIFKDSQPLSRRTSPESLRERLALSLSRWSPRLHPFTGADLKTLLPSMEWAFGALDQKYLEVAKTLQELPVQGQITIIPNAGHRLQTEAVEFVGNWIGRN